MMKFLRKYTKHMLVFVTVGILVSWLLGSTLPAMLRPDQGDEVIGRAFGEVVKQREWQIAAYRADTLRRMGLPWQKPWLFDVSQPAADRTPPLTPMHWMLLVKEARRSGVVITEERLAAFKAAVGITPSVLARVQEERYLALEDIDDIIRDFMLVREYAQQNIGSIKVSTPEVRHRVRDSQERVRISALVIPARQLVDQEEPVSEEEILAWFERYKDVLPEESDTGFGYKWPARVRLEYLELKAADVEEVVAVTDREARDYWTTHKDEFLRPVEPPATQEAETAPARAAKPYDTFSEAKPDVVAKLRKRKARDRAEEAMVILLSDYLQADWDFTKRTDDRYPEVPPIVKRDGYYEMILERFVNTEPRIAPLIQVQRTDLLTPDELRDVPGIGRSAFTLGDQRYPVTELVQQVQGLGEMPEMGGSELRSVYLAQYQSTDRVLRDPVGNCYGVRVVEVVEPMSPESVEEVRDRVVADIRTARAYERAEELARQFLEAARATSMEEALEADPGLKAKLGVYGRIQSGGPTPRAWAPGIPGAILGYRDEELIDGVFELAEGMEPDQPKPMAALSSPSQKAWLAIRIEELLPVTQDVYEQMRDTTRTRLRQQRLSMARDDWFDYGRIEKRTGWMPRQEAS